MTGQRSFGLDSTLASDVVRVLAPAAEAAGYATFWTSDAPDGEGLALLQAAAEETATIGLGVGLMPLDRWTPERIAQRVAELGLPLERLSVGVGSGGAPGAAARVRAGVASLRQTMGPGSWSVRSARRCVGWLGS